MRAYILLAAVACYSIQDLMDARCETFCRHTGYDSGIYRKENCVCQEEIGYDRSQEKRIVIKSRRPRQPAQVWEIKTDRE